MRATARYSFMAAVKMKAKRVPIIVKSFYPLKSSTKTFIVVFRDAINCLD
jgi:hypothetical protein